MTTATLIVGHVPCSPCSPLVYPRVLASTPERCRSSLPDVAYQSGSIILSAFVFGVRMSLACCSRVARLATPPSSSGGVLGRRWLHCSDDLSRKARVRAQTNLCFGREYNKQSSQPIGRSQTPLQTSRRAKHQTAATKAYICERPCSSEASSSLVNMASDRDVLSGE